MYIGLDVHKKLSYYSMVDGEGTEVKRGRFPTTCEGLDKFANELPEGAKVAIEALCQAICEEACEDRQGGCQSVSAVVEDGLLARELCSR